MECHADIKKNKNALYALKLKRFLFILSRKKSRYSKVPYHASIYVLKKIYTCIYSYV